MKKRKKIAASDPVEGFLQLVQDITFAGQHVFDLRGELLQDGMCGSWVSVSGCYTLAIRKTEEGYRAMVCNTRHCYKQVEEDVRLMYYRGNLCAIGTDGKVSKAPVPVYDKDSKRVIFGQYGAFEPEEDQIYNEQIFAEDCIMPGPDEF